MEIQAISNASATPVQSQATSESTSTSKSNQPTPQKTGGTPPAGKGGAKPAATSSSSSSAAKIHDKRDKNQDGIVSYQEELLYLLKNPTEETQNESDESTVSTSQQQAGLNAYQQSQQANGLSKSSTSV